MASNPPESPSKKRKQSTNGASLTRHQPLFGSRPSPRTLQQPPDFLTESLNNSLIPSPSPHKFKNAKTKPRKDRDRASLTAALNGTVLDNEGNKLKRPSPLPAGGVRPQRRTHQRANTTNQVTSGSVTKSKSPARPQTPPPPRGRQLLETSPATSDPSPGRGYTEAYQRIVEEENLAHEDSIDNLELEQFEDHIARPPSPPRQAQQLSTRKSGSPSTLKMSRKASPHVGLDGHFSEEAASNKDGPNGRIHSDPEIASNDEFTASSLDSGMSQYEKDLQKLQSALKSRPKAFSKANMGERGGLTLENLRRKNGSNESIHSSRSAGSFSLTGSEPSMNVPKAWGRKARPGTDWLSRIQDRKAKSNNVPPSHRHSSGEEALMDLQRRSREKGGIDDWISAAADVPLPNSERGSSLLASSSHSTPRNGTGKQEEPYNQQDWTIDDDFTGRFLQVSDSPPMRLGGARSNTEGNRDLGKLERQSPIKNEQERPKANDSRMKPQHEKAEQTPSGDVEKRSNSQDRVPLLNGWAPSQMSAQSKGHHDRAQADESLDEEESLRQETPKNAGPANSNDLAASDQQEQITTRSNPEHQPTNDRQDSHDLLRRLSRAASESPRPDKDNIPPQRKQPVPKSKVEETPQISKPKIYSKTPIVTGAWVDQTINEAQDTSPPKTVMKSPFVTGGWVETPHPTVKREPSSGPEPIAEEDEEPPNATSTVAELVKKLNQNGKTAGRKPTQEPLKYTGPALPKSALQNILSQAKGNGFRPFTTNPDSEDDPTLHLGEDTVQSLEDMIANDTDVSTTIPTPPSQATSPPSSDPSPQSNTGREAQQKVDPQSYNAVLSRLTSLAPSIRDSKKQLASLERAVSHPNLKQTNLTRAADEDECNEGGELHDFIFPCQKCGCPGRAYGSDSDILFSLRDSITYLTIRFPIPRLWYWRRNDRLPRLTWVGVLTLLAWLCVLGEWWAREVYCHPLYATSMTGYGVNIHAPRPPFVLAKVLYQETPFGNILGPFYVFWKLLVKLVSSIVGYLVGFMFGGDGEQKPPVSRDPARPSWGPDLGMMDDEYL